MNNYYTNLPRKRVSAGALFFNKKKELLILKPSYKNHWLIPGGTVDGNESPRSACIREIKEEIDLSVANIKFLCVDYTKQQKDRNESLQFIFYGGILSLKQIEKIKVDGKEIIEYKFVPAKKALKLFNRKMKKRFLECMKALKNKEVIYMEN